MADLSLSDTTPSGPMPMPMPMPLDACIHQVLVNLQVRFQSLIDGLIKSGEMIRQALASLFTALPPAPGARPPRRYPRHTRQRVVLARRGRLGLDLDGKIPGLYTKRKDALAYARYVNNLSAKLPPHQFVSKKAERRRLFRCRVECRAVQRIAQQLTQRYYAELPLMIIGNRVDAAHYALPWRAAF